MMSAMTALRRRGRSDDDDERPDEAAQLQAVVRECTASGIARRGLLLRLSRLPEELSRPHHLRLAQAALDPLADADRARLFRLPNTDLVMIWRGAATAALRATLDAVSLLFADTGPDMPDFGTLVVELDLPAEAATLLAVVEEAMQPKMDEGPEFRRATAPLDPEALAALEAALVQADVARFVRRRRICEQKRDGFQLRWEKRTLSVAELGAAVAPDRALAAEPWLFRRLTRTLDTRMLALLAAPLELRDAGPFSLDLNIATILSPMFLRFDAALPSVLRGQVVLNLSPADVMADLAAFQFARDFARARGYRLLLRGLTAATLSVFPLRRMGLDLLELRWSPDLAATNVGLLLLPDEARAVLTRAHTADALAWGQAHGITLYEGRAVTERDPQVARGRAASSRMASPILSLGEARGRA
jgi:hypothetical protein